MEKKVFINIEDSHSGHDDSYSSQTSTQGVLRLLENGYELSYEEPAAEMEGCVTTLLIEDGGLVTMTRNGAYTTQMVMERGRRHVCHYATPFGDMLLGIFAKKSRVVRDGGWRRAAAQLHYRCQRGSRRVERAEDNGQRTVKMTVCPQKLRLHERMDKFYVSACKTGRG